MGLAVRKRAELLPLRTPQQRNHVRPLEATTTATVAHLQHRAPRMKAVILAGGLGTRLAEETHLRPKPMVEVGGKPILLHILKTYSHYGIPSNNSSSYQVRHLGGRLRAGRLVSREGVGATYRQNTSAKWRFLN